ncbi:MAG: dephospho-CoA kinase [Candidatus Krumholzibacteriia bacterium]
MQHRAMPRWAVTGLAAAGKSLVCRLLERHGAEVVDADRLGHEVLERPEIQAAIAAELGSRYVRGGAIDRPALGRRVFTDRTALERLNAITHPSLAAAARRRLDEVAAAGRARVAVLEAAVYFLLPSVGRMDLVIAVAAPRELRRRRLRDAGLSEIEADSRVVAQEPLERLLHGADVVLHNTGSRADLARAVDELVVARLGPDPIPEDSP